jgi:membrane associated rhomboid family serine protease
MSEVEGRSPLALTPWVRRLLAANAVVYLLTITVFTGGWFVQTFAFSPATALAQPWTFLTYMFVHAGFLHLAFNMLMLFFFGPAVEERMGGGAFLGYYVVCGLGGAALSFLIALFTPVAPFVGASGAVLGVALAFALAWPDAPILVFLLPVPIRAKWLVVGLATLDLVPALFPHLLGGTDHLAHFAHLGGLLFGFLYLRGAALLKRPAKPPRQRRTMAPAAVAGSTDGARRREAPRRPAARAQAATPAEIDRLLDKISASGIDSLTPEERQLLSERSRQLRGH